ncbi:TetR/AcrR family transcriptional regulator [Nocardia otitidiscaviarum]|uniref:TetR/AcrR family transcriptional regulator n=1 Tax=Nocardia otitidiscaviarum TaxID=1823 RepID=UPI001894EDDF|nr:TetR/AcrR family transcriptional regulator [Nocardia otitidiscaviarum]MBF6241028.1 TetR/AcrR family transcriptional regulator [Nocardia otitidiscaviarum]
MTAATRSYGGETADQRRDRRRAALLDAALDLLAEGGANAVTKRAVCGRARLNDRYFYEHFADRDALLEALAAQITAEGLEAVVTAVLRPAPDLHAQVRAAVDAALAFMTADPRRGRLLLNSYTAEVVHRARVTSIRTIADVMAAMTRDLLGDTAPPRLDTDLAAYAAVSGVMELVAAWFRGEFDTGREHLTDLITGLLLAGSGLTPDLPNSNRHTASPFNGTSAYTTG